jgi:fluoride ion exporter CrcB/FEX
MDQLLVVLGGSIGAGGRYLLGSWLHLQPGNGFTAISAFSLETLRLVANGDLAASLLNAAGQPSVGLLAV